MLVGFKIFYVLSLFSSGNSHISIIGNEMKLASESTYIFVFYLLATSWEHRVKQEGCGVCLGRWMEGCH